MQPWRRMPESRPLRSESGVRRPPLYPSWIEQALGGRSSPYPFAIVSQPTDRSTRSIRKISGRGRNRLYSGCSAVYKRETREVIRRFLLNGCSFPRCVSALNAALACLLPRLQPRQLDTCVPRSPRQSRALTEAFRGNWRTERFPNGLQ
jgi:hypothetical protein